MDSTMVSQITHMAEQLGVQARTVLVWWFVARFAINALWAAVVMFGFHRITMVLARIGRGQQLLDIARCGAFSCNDQMFARARNAVVAEFKGDHVIP